MTPLRRGSMALGCTVAILALGVLDEVTGPAPDLTVLHLVPIVLGVLWLGPAPAMALVVLASVVEVLALLGSFSARLAALNGIVHMLVVGLFALTIDRIRCRLRTIRELKAAADYDLALAVGVHESFFTLPAITRDDVAVGLRLEWLSLPGLALGHRGLEMSADLRCVH